jgi:DNA processing protein
LVRLAPHLERARARILELLALDDGSLISAVAGAGEAAVRRELGAFDPASARAAIDRADLIAVCRHHRGYPHSLHDLQSPPAVLHVLGADDRWRHIAEEPLVAVVGARRASSYGLTVAGSLARGLAGAGVPVISGMALGIDAAAHAGALETGGNTIAVLPGGADRAYPPSQRTLHVRIARSGAAVSELAPGVGAWRWSLVARNRIVAALAAMTIVVEAGERSGALITAGVARDLGRGIGAVPGRVNAPGAAGPHRLIAAGAHLITGPQEALDAIFGAGRRRAGQRRREPLLPELQVVLDEIARGRDTAAALEGTGLDPEQGLAALAALELGGYVVRQPGGRFAVTA